MKQYHKNLTTWVLIALFFGALLGLFSPATAIQMQPLGQFFIAVVKLFIFPLLFLTLTTGISGMGSLKQLGRIGGKAFVYFEVVTTIALLLGVVVSAVVAPGRGVSAALLSSAEVQPYSSAAAHFSILEFLKTNWTLPVLLFSVVCGVVLQQRTEQVAVRRYLQQALRYLFEALHFVMLFAPLGAFGGIAFTIGKFGIATLLPLAKLMVAVYATMGLFIFLILGGLLRYYNISLWQLLRYLEEELLIVLGTASSESVLPSLMEKLERMGCSKPIVGLVVPAGYSFNLDGTTLYLAMAVLFLAQVYGIDLSWAQLATIFGVLLLTSKGAAGVTGSGFVVLAATLSAVPIVPIEGLALLLGVDRLLSEARSITNFIGNSVATLCIANHEKAFDRSKMEQCFKTAKTY